MNHEEIYEVHKKLNEEERETLRKFAAKITKVPKMIRWEVDYL